MDALTEVLGSLRARAGVFLDAEFRGSWWVDSRVDTSACATWTGDVAHVAAFHHVVEGDLSLQLADDASPCRLAGGDSVVLPFNDLHAIGNAPGRIPVTIGDMVSIEGAGSIGRVRAAGSGSRSRVICGFIGFAVVPTLLLKGLPRVIVLERTDESAWLPQAMKLAAEQCARATAGADAIVARLTDVAFVLALRQIACGRADSDAIPVRALADPVVGRALALIHRRAGEPWTLGTLAGAAATSRSVLAGRFTALAGTLAMTYLKAWRLNQAASALRLSDAPVAAIADQAGYASEAAFSRAFKRAMGEPPARWRQCGRAGSPR